MKPRISNLLLVPAALLGLALTASAQNNATLRKPDIHWEPSTDGQSIAMLTLAGVSRKDVVYDLGCGDGKLVILAAERFGAKGVGIDIDPERIKDSERNARKQSRAVQNLLKFRNEDLFEADIREATVVALYLWPWINLKLKDKLLKELKPGTRVVSNMHDMGEWKPDKQTVADGHNIYLWVIPEKK